MSDIRWCISPACFFFFFYYYLKSKSELPGTRRARARAELNNNNSNNDKYLYSVGARATSRIWLERGSTAETWWPDGRAYGGRMRRRWRSWSVGGGPLAAGRLGVGVKRKNGVGSPGAAHLGAVAAAASGSASRRGDRRQRARTPMDDRRRRRRLRLRRRRRLRVWSFSRRGVLYYTSVVALACTLSLSPSHAQHLYIINCIIYIRREKKKKNITSVSFSPPPPPSSRSLARSIVRRASIIIIYYSVLLSFRRRGCYLLYLYTLGIVRVYNIYNSFLPSRPIT